MVKLPKVFTHRMGNGQKRLVVCATLQFENSFVLLSSPSNQLLMECTFEKYWLLRRVKWPRQPDQRSICSNTNCCVWPKRMIKSIQVYFCRLQYEQELAFKLFHAIIIKEVSKNLRTLLESLYRKYFCPFVLF